MSVTSPVCLQLLPSWCTAANDEESDKRQQPDIHGMLACRGFPRCSSVRI
jgi:hypothetical protein